MKTIYILIGLTVFFSTGNDTLAQCTCTRLKSQFIEMKLNGGPAVVGSKGIVWYDNDSILKLRNPNGDTTILGGGGGVAGAGGANTQVQYNSSGLLAGDAGMTYIAANNRLKVDSLRAVFNLRVGGNATGAGTLVFLEDSDNGSNTMTLQPPAELAGNIAYTFPGANGLSGTVLTNNGSGLLTWGANGLWTEVSGNLIAWQSDSSDALYITRNTDGLYAIAPSTDSVSLGLSSANQNSRIELHDSLGAASSIRVSTDIFSLSGVVENANGTAANPSVAFTNSTGMGLYRNASNVLGIATAGSERLTVDAQGDLNIASGGRGINSATDTDIWADFRPTDAQQNISGAGAVNITAYYTAITTTGADAFTFANGTNIGQVKKVTLVVDGGDATITPTSLTGGTTITMNDAGDYVLLKWNGTAWTVIENSGCVIA